MSSSSTTNKIIVVANRLPIKAVRCDNNNSGGLVSALQGVKGKNILTIGWIGETISNEIDQQIITKELAERVIIYVDRLDIAKGILEKILGFKNFLIENPIREERVILVQIAVLSRQDVQQYKEYTSDVHKVVRRFYDSKFFYIDSPLRYVEGTLEFHELCALYSLADVALVTSWRDGMNLVSYEFVACQASRKGVLILSEFAGAAKYLRGAITVDPVDLHQMVFAIGKALDMLPGEREQRHALNFKHVTEHTAEVWAQNCLSAVDGH